MPVTVWFGIIVTGDKLAEAGVAFPKLEYKYFIDPGEGILLIVFVLDIILNPLKMGDISCIALYSYATVRLPT